MNNVDKDIVYGPVFFLAGQVLMNFKTEKSQKLPLWSAKSLFCLTFLTHGVTNGIESKQ